jgi:hypothetical protein
MDGHMRGGQSVFDELINKNKLISTSQKNMTSTTHKR